MRSALAAAACFALVGSQKVGAPLEGGEYVDDKGVFQSYSHDLAPEVAEIVTLTQLRPGLTYCEMGGANGLFLAALGKAVMPGGRLQATAPLEAEITAMGDRVKEAGLADATTLTLATDDDLGLAPGSCDVIFSRMVYHMLSNPAGYLVQLKHALRPAGRMLILDHDADSGVTLSRVNATLDGMAVVPRAVELEEFTGAGFALVGVANDWRYFGEGERGYGLLWMHAPAAAADAEAGAAAPPSCAGGGGLPPPEAAVLLLLVGALACAAGRRSGRNSQKPAPI